MIDCDCGNSFEPIQTFSHRVMCGNSNTELDILLKDKKPDCVITSPPYDTLRKYGEDDFNFESIATQLYKSVKEGGIVVWIVGDMIIDESESGTSFNQALFFKKIGFNLHDTMIYGKIGYRYPETYRYLQSFEYMFILTKGRPKTFNPITELNKKENTNKSKSVTNRQKDGSLTSKVIELKNEHTISNIWFYDTGYMKSTTDKIAFDHPAIFPLQLAVDHVNSWTKKNDLILDTFLGSGTTLMAAEKHDRVCYGMESNPAYIDVILQRWSDFTKIDPIRVNDGKKWSAIKEEKNA